MHSRIPFSRRLRLAGAALCFAIFSGHVSALPFLDASNDLLPSYTGPKDADLDVVQADVVIDPSAGTVTFSATMRGSIDTRSGKLYVFGIDRGAGAAGGNLIFHGPVGGEPKIGAHDKPVLFLHPKDFTGTLIELEQV